MRQVGASIIGRRGDFLEHAGERVGRDARQRHAEAHAGHAAFAPGRLRIGALGHQRIDLVDELAEFRIEPVARMEQRNPDFRGDAAGIRGEHQDAVAHQHRLLDIVGHHQDRFDRHPPFRPEIEKIGAQGLRGQHVERRKRLVHQQNLRLHDERAGKADALAHAAGKLLGIGRFETVEADDVDRCERALARFGGRCAMGAQADLDIVEHGQPGKQRKALEHHRDAVVGAGRRAGRRRSPSPLVGRDRPEMMRSKVDLPQPERPSRADDLALFQRQRNVLQDRRARSRRSL